MSYSRQVIDRFIELRAQGMSFEKIASQLNVSKPTLVKWSMDYREEIAGWEYKRAQELMTQHNLNRYAIFEETLAELDRVRKAVKARDLSKENFKTLLDLETELDNKASRLMYVFKKAAEQC